MALTFIEPELWVIEILHCGNRILDFFCSGDLDLDPMTFIFVFLGDTPDVQIWTSYVKAFRQLLSTYIHTDRHDQNYIPQKRVLKCKHSSILQ